MNKLILILFAAFFLLTADLFPQVWNGSVKQSPKPNLYEIQKEFNNYWKDKKPRRGLGWKQYCRMEAFWGPRVYPTGEFPDANSLFENINQYNSSKKNTNKLLSVNPPWTFLGPNTQPVQGTNLPPSGMGRLNCITFEPNSSNSIWTGACFGGVWKTADGGVNWATFDFTNFLSIGVSDIAVAPTNHNIVYVAIGDADAAGIFGANWCYSIGVIKSTDAGKTWQKTALQTTIDNHFVINKLLVNPSNENIVFAATNGGMFKTTNGGNNWTMLTNNQTICRDIAFKPNDPTIIYCTFFDVNTNNKFHYTLQKYDDSKGSFTLAKDFYDVLRIKLAVTPGNVNYVYALCCDTVNGFHSFWRSYDNGTTWKQIGVLNNVNYLGAEFDGSLRGGQGMYDLALAVSPTNSEEIYIGGVNIWKSTDGGSNFRIVSDWTGENGPWVHADIHDLKFSSGGVLYAATDGGISKTDDKGASWSDISAGLQVTQFYKMSTSLDEQGTLFSGAQDNGTHRLRNTVWTNIRGGDGMQCIVDYTNANIIYSSLYFGDYAVSFDGGDTYAPIINDTVTKERGEWVTPMVIDPITPTNLYAGYNNVWKTTNRGTSWTNISKGVFTPGITIHTLAIAPSDPNVLYAAYGNNLYYTTNGGTKWLRQRVSTQNEINDIAIDPNNPRRFWFVVCIIFNNVDDSIC